MKTLATFFICVAMSFLFAFSSQSASPIIVPDNSKSFENIKSGDVYHSFFVDLDSDGKEEKVLIKYIYLSPAGNEEIGCGQIVVQNLNGKTLFQSPTHQDKCLLIISPAGVDELEIAYDFDGDRKLEFLIQRGRSDVGLSSFNLYEWQGKRLVKIKKDISFVLNKKQSFFELADSEPYYRNMNITFLQSFISAQKTKSGNSIAKVSSYQLEGKYKYCEVEVKPEKNGFKLISPFTNCQSY